MNDIKRLLGKHPVITDAGRALHERGSQGRPEHDHLQFLLAIGVFSSVVIFKAATPANRTLPDSVVSGLRVTRVVLAYDFR